MASNKHRRFRIGETVRFMMGKRQFQGTIVEDRGFVGHGGRHLYRVEVKRPSYEATLELPESELQIESVA